MHTFLSHPSVQIFWRCIAIYIFIILAIRIFGKTELAQLSVTDLVFILLISNAVQTAMMGKDSSLQGGIIAACSLFMVNYLLKRFLFTNKRASSLIQGESLLLIYKGQMNAKNLRQARISLEELQAAIREHGIESIEHVDLSMLEVDGNVSVISGDFNKKSSHEIPGKLPHHKQKNVPRFT